MKLQLSALAGMLGSRVVVGVVVVVVVERVVLDVVMVGMDVVPKKI